MSKKKKKKWKKKLSEENQQFVDQNFYRIEKFIKSKAAKGIAGKYYTTIEKHHDVVRVELYYALRRIACDCNDKDTAFNWYGPEVFRRSLKEYFIKNLRSNRREKKAIIIHQEELTDPKPFKLFGCPKIRSFVRKAIANKKQKHAFILRISHPKGLMTFKEIGEQLGCNKSNAKKHFDKAIKKQLGRESKTDKIKEGLKKVIHGR